MALGGSLDALRTDLRDAALIARVELRRSWRRVTDTERAALKLGGLVAVWLVYAAGAGMGGFAVGVVLRSEEIDAGIVGARAVALFVLFSVAFVAVQRTVKQIGWPDAPAAVLTAAAPRAVAVGHVASEAGRYLAFVAVPLVAGGIGVAAGARSVAAGLAVVAAGTALVVGGTALGYVGGLLGKALAARSALVQRHRTAIGIASAAAIPALYTIPLAVDVDVSLAALERATDALPPTWLGDPIAAAVPGVAVVPVRAAVGATLLLAVPVGGVALAGHLAERLWTGERTRPTQERDAPGFGGHRVERVLSGIVDRPARRVAVTAVRRAVRSPITVQYAVVPVFFLFYEVQTYAISGVVPPRLPITVGLVGVVVTGGLFCLNPIGKEGAVLPAVLTTGAGGRPLVAGAAVGALLAGLPVTVVAVAVVAAASSVGPAVAVADVLGIAALCVAATGIAAALGTRYPKRAATRISGDREVVVPSPWAFLGFLLVTLAVGLPALVGHLNAVAEAVAVSPAVLRLGGVGLSVALGALAGVVGYRRAVRRADGYRLA